MYFGCGMICVRHTLTGEEGVILSSDSCDLLVKRFYCLLEIIDNALHLRSECRTIEQVGRVSVNDGHSLSTLLLNALKH